MFLISQRPLGLSSHVISMSSVFRWTHGQYYAEVEDRKQELKRYLIFLIWFHFNVVSYFPVSLKLYIMLMLKRPLNL